MATYIGTTIFRQGGAGWSESWYLSASNHDQALEKLQSIGPTRAKLLGGGAAVEYQRISDVAIKGDSKITVINEYALSSGVTAADEPWDAVYVRVEAGPLYRRQMWLRGIPDEWAGSAGGFPGTNPNNNFLSNAMDKFAAKLKAVPMQLKCIDKEGAGGTKTPITGLAADGSGRTVVSVAVSQGAVGDEFRISGYDGPDKAKLNGVHKIAAIGAGTVTIPLMFASLTAPAENAGGKAQPRIIVYKDVTNLIIMRMAKKSTGRAFFLPVGRRRA